MTHDTTNAAGKLTKQLSRTQTKPLVSENEYSIPVENADCIVLRLDTRGDMALIDEFAQGLLAYTERDNSERRFLEKEILAITEREREPIGQERHDGLAITKPANRAIARMRNLAKPLDPIDIETGGLMAAWRLLAFNAKHNMGVACRFPCDPAVSVNHLVEAKRIYRIVREAMTNAVRHGKSKQIAIKLHAAGNRTLLTVSNDGPSLPPIKPCHQGLGLKIMKYRTDLPGGSLDLRQGAQGGTAVTCVFPNPAVPEPNRVTAASGSPLRFPGHFAQDFTRKMLTPKVSFYK